MASTYSAGSMLPGGRPIPIRSRRNAPVPRRATMSRSPLCPPWPPPSRSRTSPNGRSRSSWTISKPSAVGRQRSTALRTTSPLSFMKPAGRTNPERLIGTGTSPGWALSPMHAIAAATARAPTLCRVCWYCLSALPSPTTTRVVGLPVARRLEAISKAISYQPSAVSFDPGRNKKGPAPFWEPAPFLRGLSAIG